jgi:hypothetical protein
MDTKMKKKYYLAYGSNLNVEQMAWRCPRAVPMGTAYIEDYELLFKGSRTGSYLTIEKKAGARVPVAVWKVTAEDERALDRYEGFPIFYYKKEMPIAYTGIMTGKTYEADAFVYIMHEDRPMGIPSKTYVAVCLEGYTSFGFDQRYIWEAVEKSKSEVTA